MAKLIVLHGPSGSGKSTVAKDLLKRSSSPLVLLEEDHFRRRIFYNPSPDNRLARVEVCKKILLAGIQAALANNFNVIVEGILPNHQYKAVFEDLAQIHKKIFCFDFDVSLEETFKRHQTRSESDQFGEERMRQWYSSAAPYDFPYEKIITESSTQEDSVKTVKETAGI